MTAYVFPGQGSQIKGMGKELFAEFPDLAAKATAILGYSLEKLCLDDPLNQLNQTQYTQPALYAINALTYLKKLKETDKKPAFIAGHSLGEYNALLAANVFDFETGLKIVMKRGQLMSQATDGGMAAIVGLKEDFLNDILKKHNLTSVSFANYNSHTQIVLSGKKSDVEQARALCEQAGAALAVTLKVSGAFHSPHMKSFEEQFESFLRGFKFSAPAIPVIANCNARPYPSTENDIIKNLAAQMTNPVRWSDSIEYLLKQGVSDFVEIGPGAVLTGLIRRIKNGQ